ncbi:amidohydrolase family protein [Ahniella affigens]|nr:amidohydrolase family protein [Ahniella affigens]
MDLILRNGNLPDGRSGIDLGIDKGRIVALTQNLEATALREIDATGKLVSPPFVDAHFHLDSALTYGQPRINQSGTLLEGIALWAELKPTLTIDSMVARALRYCELAISQGLLAIRSHVDTSDARLLGVEALLEVQQKVAPWLDLQLVAFPQDGLYRNRDGEHNLLRALDMGVNVVGGIPHFERTMHDGTRSVTRLLEIAASRGLRADLHCDESDDPHSRHVETLAAETLRLGLQGRVAGSHLTSMHSMDNYYVSKLLPLMAESGVAAIANPLINITLQGRHDTYPKRRGMTRVPELLAAGVPVAFGHDCVLDPWYSFGSADMLEVAHMGIHVGQMTAQSAIHQAFEAVTTTPARILGLDDYGLAVGKSADLLLLDAENVFHAIRTRADRLLVLRRGQILLEQAPRTVQLNVHW